jgi:SAM-dependent methyltransferase
MTHDIREEFDKIERHADHHWWYVGMRSIALATLERFLPKRDRALRIVEIGCGTGVNLAYLAKFGIPEGIEYHEYALELARKKGYEANWGDMHRLQLPNDSYDVVVFFEVLNQAPRSALRAILTSVKNGLAPGGIMLIREPALEFLRGNHDVEWSTESRFSKRELKQLFEELGLNVLYLGYANSFLLPIVAVMRKLGRLLGSRPQSDFQVHSRFVNSMFAAILGLEKSLLRYVRFPLGVTVLAVVEKPG